MPGSLRREGRKEGRKNEGGRGEIRGRNTRRKRWEGREIMKGRKEGRRKDQIRETWKRRVNEGTTKGRKWNRVRE